LVDGRWLEEPGRVKEEIRHFFRKRFEETKWERPKLDGVRFKAIEQQHNNLLAARFDEGEVRDAV